MIAEPGLPDVNSHWVEELSALADRVGTSAVALQAGDRCPRTGVRIGCPDINARQEWIRMNVKQPVFVSIPRQK